jgi:pimeloyl-ACP methyl ester carboxylesterase
VDAVAVGGLNITYQRVGSGDPLVLLHGGFGFDSRSWRPQLDGLADEFNVVAWDAPGCGGSDDPPDSFQMADYADCLAEFLTAIDVRRPHVLGISFGGALALALYGRHPTLPGSLILAGAYAGWAGSLPADEVQRRVRQVSTDLTQRPEAWMPKYLPGMLTESAPPDMADQMLALMADIRPQPALTMLRAMADSDLRGVLPSIEVPTLVLHGELDVRSPLSIGRELHRRIRGSRLVVLPEVGHLSNVEAAEPFNREVRSFLRSLPSTSD